MNPPALQHAPRTSAPFDLENQFDHSKPFSSQSTRTFGRDITNQQLRDFDSPDSLDPTRLTYYAKEIHQFLHESQGRYQAKAGYMRRQVDITEKMRTILIDWLAEVHHKFKLVPETLFLGVNFLDRYLEKEEVQRVQLQLVGVVALELACKFEELYTPEIREFVYVTDNAFTVDQFLALEVQMLRVLDYAVAVPTAHRFFERYARLAQLEEKAVFLGEYAIELGLLECAVLKYKPSLVAAAGVYIARKMLDATASWGVGLTEATNHSESEVKPCAKDLVILLQSAAKSKHNSLHRKFSSEKYLEVARIRVSHSTPRSSYV